MIHTDGEYQIAKTYAESFERKARALADAPPPGAHPRIVKAQYDAARSIAEELREELAEYEARIAERCVDVAK